MKMRIAGITPESVVDGPGIRLVVFFQGCPHACSGCHNPQTHDFKGGEEIDTAEILAQFAARPGLAGITLSGGEPLAQPAAAAELAAAVHEGGKNVLLYSGYTWEELLTWTEQDETVKRLLNATDIVIDGRYDETQRNLALAFRGSSNQRVIDVAESRGKTVPQIIRLGRDALA